MQELLLGLILALGSPHCRCTCFAWKVQRGEATRSLLAHLLTCSLGKRPPLNCLVLFAHLFLPLLHLPFGAAARRVRPLGPWQAGASLRQLALLHLPECGSLFLTSCCGTSLSCSLCVSERLPIIKKVQVLAEEEEEVARRDSDMSIDDSDFL